MPTLFKVFKKISNKFTIFYPKKYVLKTNKDALLRKNDLIEVFLTKQDLLTFKILLMCSINLVYFYFSNNCNIFAVEKANGINFGFK